MPSKARFVKFRPWVLASVAAMLTCPTALRADSFNSYQLVESFLLPGGAGPTDSLADGRLMTIVGSTIYIETMPNGRTFVSQGNLPQADIASFGAAFLRVSPDGAKFAVGNNGGASFSNFQIGIFNVSNLTGTWFTAAHYDAAWIDNTKLAITAGDFGSPAFVTVLDVKSPNPNVPDNRTIISNIGGASAGIAFDAAGNLYTGNGFQGSGPSGTGATKEFSHSTWLAAYTSGPHINFEPSGTSIVDVLSASPLAFDGDGNLFIGGGDFSANDIDFVAITRASAVSAAVSGGGAINPADPSQLRRLDPDTSNNSNFYSVNTNPVLHEVYVRDLSGDRVYVYLDTSSIPTISQWGAAAFALGVLCAGTIVLKGRQVLGCQRAADNASNAEAA
ncbi:MAG: hypothetical protein HY287_09615 [Planctomycetes bacterium]|nr:hypothetical protein [Planctomycetota bacterium]MBI3834570.1 hypothetical protein [Planctomycetota bacterium]